MAFPRRIVLLLIASLATPLAINGIPLLGGRFETTTDVQEFLNLALDASDMKETDDLAAKKAIYRDGVKRDNEQNSDISLASLSLRASQDMMENPYFHMFRHAFLVLGDAEEGETEGRFDGSAIEQYGDTLVEDLFDLNVEGIETEAAVVLNVWMSAINELFQVRLQCKSNDMNKALGALDRAAALWIGEGQKDGINDSGHLLYALTENAGERFDQDTGETTVNTEIIDLFVQIQKNIKADKCSDLDGYLNRRQEIKRMVSLMTIPLLQNLIHHTINVESDHGSDWVELYALATIPRVAVCDPSTYNDELQMDVLREMTKDYIDQSLNGLESAYSCFSITCTDIGSYRGTRPVCKDPDGVTVAGYSSQRKDVKQKSYLDRDIREIDIFMKFKAYGLAVDWYQYGWNGLYNLQFLALEHQDIPKNTDDVNPYTFEIFQDYYESPNYADQFITSVFELKVPYNDASPEQVRWLLTNYLTYVVMYVNSASALEYAADQCVDGNKDSALDYWDTGAMFYIGSMEGELPNGSDPGGLLLFSTAKNLCEEFGTCVTSDEGDGDIPSASANDIIVSGLKDGMQKINDGDCDAVDGILETILRAMPVPLFQGAIKYASYVAGLPADSDSGSLAIADAFARSILPLVDEGDNDSASSIEKALEFEPGKNPGNFMDVMDALSSVISLVDVQCEQIGVFVDEADDADLCAMKDTDPDFSIEPMDPTSPTDPGSPVSQPTNPPLGGSDELGWGRYTFSNLEAAEADAKFALDVKEMYEATDVQVARDIYNSGKNANTTGLDGSIGVISLSSLSTQSANYMKEDPMFNVFKFDLKDDDDNDGATGFEFADVVINLALDNANDMRQRLRALSSSIHGCSWSTNYMNLLAFVTVKSHQWNFLIRSSPCGLEKGKRKQSMKTVGCFTLLLNLQQSTSDMKRGRPQSIPNCLLCSTRHSQSGRLVILAM